MWHKEHQARVHKSATHIPTLSPLTLRWLSNASLAPQVTWRSDFAEEIDHGVPTLPEVVWDEMYKDVCNVLPVTVMAAIRPEQEWDVHEQGMEFAMGMGKGWMPDEPECYRKQSAWH